MDAPHGPDRPSADAIARARRAILARTGVDIGPYKESVISRRLRTRARDEGFADLEGYLARLEGTGPTAAEPARRLLASFSVGVSGFFRDAEVFRAVGEQIAPTLFAGRPAGEPVRVWSAACSRGQEAYSLAILLGREARRLERDAEISVLGTDVDERALEVARAGVYPPQALEDLPPGLVREAFESIPGEGWRVRPEIRRRVHFQRGDALDFGTHPRGVDLIACRNLLIYLRRAVQEDFLLALHRALRPGGFLVLGTSETVLGRPWHRFEHVDPARRLYRKPAAT